MKIYEDTNELFYHEIVEGLYIGVSDLYYELNDDKTFEKILNRLNELLPEFVSVQLASTVFEIELRTAIAERDEMDELDYFIEFFEDFTLDDLKYDPSKYEYAKEFAEEHIEVLQEGFDPVNVGQSDSQITSIFLCPHFKRIGLRVS